MRAPASILRCIRNGALDAALIGILVGLAVTATVVLWIAGEPEGMRYTKSI